MAAARAWKWKAALPVSVRTSASNYVQTTDENSVI